MSNRAMSSAKKSFLAPQSSLGLSGESQRRKSNDALSNMARPKSESVMIADLPWAPLKVQPNPQLDYNVLPARYSAQTLLLELFNIFERKLNVACNEEPLDKLLSKSLRRGEDAYLDNLLRTLSGVCEVCLPSVLNALIRWHETQQKVPINENGEAQEKAMKRTLGASYLYCVVLIEVLPKVIYYPAECEQLVNHILKTSFKQVSFRDPDKFGNNYTNSLVVAEIFAEVIGVFSQSHFKLVHKLFSQQLETLRKETPCTTLIVQKIISLLMAMKFFRININQLADFEMGVAFLNELGQFYLEVDLKQKDLKHSLAGLLVEILLPAAGEIKTEANVPSLIAFVDKLYGPTWDLVNKKQHRMATYPLLTCLLCISQNKFFLNNWVPFLNLTLANLKNKDPKTARVALESLYRLIWVYSIRINCEGNSATRSRLESICSSLFPKGNRNVIPRNSPFIIFVKIIHFIAFQKLDFAFKEIIFDLLGVNRLSARSISIYPERMNIGLRALMVITDGLQQKDGPPGMPRSMGPVPASGTIQRIKKTYITQPLTPDVARSIGLDQYYYPCRKAFDVILRTLDLQVGRTFLLTAPQTRGKEPEDLLVGDVKPKLDLFRTCIAAVPRLLPDPMTHQDLIELLTRICVHIDEELRMTAFQTLQHLIAECTDWREDIINAQLNFITNNIQDTFPALLETMIRFLLQLLCTWKSSAQAEKRNPGSPVPPGQGAAPPAAGAAYPTNLNRQPTSSQTTVTSGSMAESMHSPDEQAPPSTVSLCSELGSPYSRTAHGHAATLLAAHPTALAIHNVEGFALVLLCQLRAPAKKMAVQLLRECRQLLQLLALDAHDEPVLGVLDAATPHVLDKYFEYVPANERQAWGRDFVAACDRLSTLETDAYLVNCDKGNEYWRWDAWACALSGYCEYHLIPTKCPTAVAFAWPALFIRLNHCTQYVDPSNPQNETRASLLRSSKSKATASSMCGEAIGQDSYLSLWQKYLVMCCALCPPLHPSSNPPRSFSPSVAMDLDVVRSMIGSSRIVRPASINSAPFFAKICSMLRWDNMIDMRDSVVLGVGSLNPICFDYLLDEMTNRNIMREAQEKKVRSRNKRRDLLRLQVVRILEIAVFRGLLVYGNQVDAQTGTLSSVLLKMLDSLRENVVSEADRDIAVLTSLRLHFAKTLTLIVQTVPIDRRKALLPEDLKRELVQVMFRWCGRAIATMEKGTLPTEKEVGTFVEKQSVSALCALLCCGPILNQKNDEDYSIRMLDALLISTNQAVCNIYGDTLATVLHLNDQSAKLFEWTVNMCYVKNSTTASKAFKALVLLFSRREFPCDFVCLFTLCQIYALDSDASVQQSALLLLQILRRQFLDDELSPCQTNATANGTWNESGNHSIIAKLALGRPADPDQSVEERPEQSSGPFPINHATITTHLSRLYPQLTMPIFSEVCARLETAKPNRQAAMLSVLLHWIKNIELVDPHCDIHEAGAEGGPEDTDDRTAARSGWGSAEATQLLLNNLLYISAKLAAEHGAEIAALWKCLAQTFAPNLPIVLHHLNIMISLSPDAFIPVAKQVAEHLLNASGDRLVALLVDQLSNGGEQFKLSLIRSEIPPYYRWQQLPTDDEEEANVGEKPSEVPPAAGEENEDQKNVSEHADGHNSSKGSQHVEDRSVETLEISSDTTHQFNQADPNLSDVSKRKPDVRQLPMPAYGGHYSSLSAFLPPSTQPVSYFPKSNMATFLLSELIGSDFERPVRWADHAPILLNVAVASLDSSRTLVCHYSRLIILRLCLLHVQPGVNVGQVANLLLSHQMAANEAELLERFKSQAADSRALFQNTLNNTSDSMERNNEQREVDYVHQLFEDNTLFPSPTKLLMALSFCLTNKMDRPLWANEEVSMRNWQIESADQLGCFVRHLAEYFIDSMSQLAADWTSVAMRTALCTSNRHAAGRCFQMAGALCQSLAPHLSQCLSRLVEVVGDHGEDAQSYITHLFLCLHAAIPHIIQKSVPAASVDVELKAISPVSSTHNRSISHTPGLLQRPADRQPPAATSPHQSPNHHHTNLQHNKKDTRHSLLIEDNHSEPVPLPIARCKSDQLLHTAHAGFSDPALHALSQLVSICVCMLESQVDNEFLLAIHLLNRVLECAGNDKEQVVERFESVVKQLNWNNFNGVVALACRGVILPAGYANTVSVLARCVDLLDHQAIGTAQSLPLIVVATLPYCLHHFDQPTTQSLDLCRQVRDQCARALSAAVQDQQDLQASEHPLQNLSTMMTQYMDSSFARDRFQWARCVLNYTVDAFHPNLTQLAVYLAEVLERSPSFMHVYLLNLIHLVLTHGDLTDASPASLNAQVVRVVTKHVQSANWREAARILKAIQDQWNRIGVREAVDQEVNTDKRKPDFDIYVDLPPPSNVSSPPSPRKLAPPQTTSNGDSLRRQTATAIQSRVRERLCTLMTASGLPVGLPRSSSVIFAQSSSDIHHHQHDDAAPHPTNPSASKPSNLPTMATNSQYSSSELISHPDDLEALSGSSMANAGGAAAGNESMTTDSFPRVFKEFDFLEAEHDTISESNDSCFNWLSTMKPPRCSAHPPDADAADHDEHEDDEFLNPNEENDDYEEEEDDELDLTASVMLMGSRPIPIRGFGVRGARRRMQRASGSSGKRPLSGASDSNNDVSSDRTPVQSTKHSSFSSSCSSVEDEEEEEDEPDEGGDLFPSHPAKSSKTFSSSYYKSRKSSGKPASVGCEPPARPHHSAASAQSPIETNSTASFLIPEDTTAILETNSSVPCRSEFSASQQTAAQDPPRMFPLYMECTHHSSGFMEKSWLDWSALIIGDQAGDLTAHTVLAFTQLVRENGAKLSGLLRDASHVLAQASSASTPDRPLRDVSAYFTHALNAIIKLGDFPFVFFTSHFLRSTNLLQGEQDMLYFLRQHYETFMEKREQCIRALNQMRSAVKLHSLTPTLAADQNLHQLELEVCKCFERLFFQLLSILERFRGIVSLIQNLPNAQEFDLSPAVINLHRELLGCAGEIPLPLSETRVSSISSLNLPVNDQLQDMLFLHLTNKNYKSALITLRQLRAQHGSEFGCCEHMDVDVLLLQFCRSHRLRTWAVLGQLDAARTASDQLKETNMQMSALVRSMERESSGSLSGTVRSSRVGSVTEPPHFNTN